MKAHRFVLVARLVLCSSQGWLIVWCGNFVGLYSSNTATEHSTRVLIGSYLKDAIEGAKPDFAFVNRIRFQALHRFIIRGRIITLHLLSTINEMNGISN